MFISLFFGAFLAHQALASGIASVSYGGVSSALEGNMKLMAQYAGAAYCATNYLANATEILCEKGVCPLVTADKATDFAHHISVVSNEIGFVSVDPVHKLVVLALIGTVSVRNYITDFEFLQVPCRFGLGCLVHSGFNAAWLEIHSTFVPAIQLALEQNPDYYLVVTGHSLGGAVATVAAANLREDGHPCDLYTFGSPRVFNSVGANYVSGQPGRNIRVTHWDDPVPRLPPLLLPGTEYRHTSPEYWLSLGNATRTDYTPSQIAICTGNANVHCNAKFWEFDTTAHSYYFGYLSACHDSGLHFKRDTANMEVRDKWEAFSRADAEYFQLL